MGFLLYGSLADIGFCVTVHRFLDAIHLCYGSRHIKKALDVFLRLYF